MTLFHPEAPQRSPDHVRVYALYELAYTAVDFLAALLFLIGSILFFDEATTYLATWLFVVGSFFFAVKPTLKLSREFKYWRMGYLDRLAKEAESE
ncbi:MAG: YrhK family protein [Pseudomonadota bacterium]